MKILAVDDDPFILELLKMITAKLGFADISTAPSGEMAFDMLKGGDTTFDCLLLDINMPGMSGTELCRKARQMQRYRRTPILMLTAMTEKSFVDDAFKAGATDYVTKPFAVPELGARLRIAEEIVLLRKEAEAAQKDRSTASGGQSTDAAEDLEASGTSHLIDYTALCNYLAQLTRSRLDVSQVLAVKIDRIESINAKASPEEFKLVLSKVADAIGHVFRPHNHVMAYSGDGFFLVVCDKENMEPSIGLEMEVQDIIDDMQTEFGSDNPFDLEVSIGNPIRPSTAKPQPIRKTFERAIARAASRKTKKKGTPRVTNIRAVRG